MTDIKTDRSRIITFQFCPRKRHWAYEWDDVGLEGNQINFDLLMGSYVHKLLERVPKGDWEAHIPHIVTDFQVELEIDDPTDDYLMRVMEYSALIEALVRGFVALRWPRIDREYKVVEVEKEYTLDLGSGVKLMTRLDWR